MADEPSSGGGGNVFTRKMGPFPLWVWMALALLLALIYYMFNKNKSSSSGSASQAAENNAAGGVDSSLVPQFVNQTYVNNAPPTATATTSQATPPAAGGPVTEAFSAGHVISPSHQKATVGWTDANVSANGAQQIKVVLMGPGIPSTGQVRYIPASATTATFDNLQKGHKYTAQITPVGANGQNVGTTGYVDFTTT